MQRCSSRKELQSVSLCICMGYVVSDIHCRQEQGVEQLSDQTTRETMTIKKKVGRGGVMASWAGVFCFRLVESSLWCNGLDKSTRVMNWMMTMFVVYMTMTITIIIYIFKICLSILLLFSCVCLPPFFSVMRPDIRSTMMTIRAKITSRDSLKSRSTT